MTRNSPSKKLNGTQKKRKLRINADFVQQTFSGLTLIRLFSFDLRLKSSPNGTQKNRKLRIIAD